MFQNGIKSLDEKIVAAMKTSDDKIAVIEKQLTMVIGSGVGRQAESQVHQSGASQTIALIGMICAVVLGGAGLFLSMLRMK
jgi:hypothetical protein